MYGKRSILNVDVLSLTCQNLLDNLSEGVLVTPNVDHLVKLQKDRAFYDCYQKADWVICDSRVLYFCMKLICRSIPESISGSSFFTRFYEYHKYDENCKIFLLGAMNGVANKAMEKINKRMGRQMVVGALSPSFGFEKKPDENEDIHKMINESGANVVLVGVGAPKQEKWIMAHKDKMPGVKIWMALGATIDFEAGNLKRAPQLMQDMALEWLYRLICEPKRMFKRYFCDDMIFFVYLFKQICGKYRNPFEI